MFDIFENNESNVRSYCRKFPAVFNKAINAEMWSIEGKRYIDFLSVAGSMNYGHNNSFIKKAVIDYLAEDSPINMLDMYTPAKKKFISELKEQILDPRGMDYRIMFCGPTGTNAVEASLKLARKNTHRTGIIAFGGAFHGMTLGSLSCTTDKLSREGAGVALNNVTHVPFDGTPNLDSKKYLEWILRDDHSGIEIPAAIILETVQAEGGVNVASISWLKYIRSVCDEFGIVMIVDDIQVGCGRTGYYFSFERAGINPDMIVMSKSVSGLGLPMSFVLIKPQYDIFRPAEHNGTFRGCQLSFVGGTAGIEFFNKNEIPDIVRKKSLIIEKYIMNQIIPINNKLSFRGIGMIWGIDFSEIDSKMALKVIKTSFKNGLILEVAGRNDSVIKLMPPLTIEEDILIEGLNILKNSVEEVLKES